MEIETLNEEFISPQTLSFVNDFYKRAEHGLESKLFRLDLDYTNKSERFRLKTMKHNVQYSSLYFTRLAQLKTNIKKKLESLSLGVIDVINVKKNSKVVVIGTLFKEMKLRPTILNKMNAENFGVGPKQLRNFVSDNDVVYIEDHKARAKLAFDEKSVFQCDQISLNQKRISHENLIVGIVVGIIGYTDERGTIVVEKIVFDESLPQENKEPYDCFIKQAKILNFNDYSGIKNLQPLEKYIASISKDDKFIALLSGLNTCPEGSQLTLRMLKSFLFGGVASSPLAKLASRVTRMIFAGNLIAEQQELLLALQGTFKIQDTLAKLQQELAKAIKNLDSFFLDMAQRIPVDLMPGEQDPTDARLPQQPLNQSYFHSSYEYGNLNSVPNPYEFELDRMTILGTSGQNVTDIMQYSRISSDVTEIMKCNLLWRHLAPTAPDSLRCYPFHDDEDPFIIGEMPHIYFAGNQEKFETKLLVDDKERKICRLVSVPVFSKTHSIVLVNLRNLDAFEISFNPNEED